MRMLYSKVIGLILLGVACNALAQGQPAERQFSRQDYINMYSEDAVREMLNSGVPASITLAQGILESNSGNSPLARYANNHFGIKCHSDWDGPTFIQDDDAKNECFRKYYDVYASFGDHSEFLSTRNRYAFLFDIKRTDYKGWARGLKKAGYATNPKYADLLIRIIEDEELYKFDKLDELQLAELKKKQGVAPKPAPKPAPVTKVERKVVAKVHDNNIKYVVAQQGDTYYQIARQQDVELWQIYKYNDLSKGDMLYVGDIIYLQPKRKKAKVEYCVVKQGDTARTISQQYGIKIKHIYKKNDLPIGADLKPGQKLYLRKRVSLGAS